MFDAVGFADDKAFFSYLDAAMYEEKRNKFGQ